MILKFMHEFAYQRYGIDSKVFQFLHRNKVFGLPMVLLPLVSLKVEDVEKFEKMLQESLDAAGNKDRMDGRRSWLCLPWFCSDREAGKHLSEPEQDPQEEGDQVNTSAPDQQGNKVTVFRADIRLVSVITDVAIFFTFGTIFPPLAVVGFVSICLHTLTMDVTLGRMLWLARYHYPALHRAYQSQQKISDGETISQTFPKTSHSTVLEKYVKIMNKECHGASQLLSKSLLSISYLLAMFWSLFLYDILGDAVGAREAIWIIVLMGTFAGVVDFFNFVASMRNKRPTELPTNQALSATQIDQERGLELDSLMNNISVMRDQNDNVIARDNCRETSKSYDGVLNPIQC
jgi:ABC-type multidrug transport system fused ATPase/permease subunit